MNKVVRFKGNTRLAPREAGNLYADKNGFITYDEDRHPVLSVK